jgi:hypothetical protein
MNDQPELETLLESAFRGVLPPAPASLVAALEDVPSQPLMRDGAPQRLAGRGRPWIGALGVAAVVLIGGALALSIGGPRPFPVTTPPPSVPAREAASSPADSSTGLPAPTSGAATSFIAPFIYTHPAGSTMTLAIEKPEIIGWINGPSPQSSPRYSDRQSGPDPAEGIVVVSAEQAWSHDGFGSTGRFAVRQAPTDLLADLRDPGAVGFGEISAVTLDGRPALMADINPAGKGGSDLHVTGDMCCISRDFIMLNVPSRVFVLEVGEVTIFIQVWARTDDDLAALMPAATEFVESIRFIDAS